MARDNDGVGRGNGEGSRRTQFESGKPSANPSGRPRRAKQAPNASMKDAVRRQMTQAIVTRQDGVTSKHTQTDAMIMLLFSRYPSATIREQVAILRFVGEIVPATLQEENRELSPMGIQEFVERLAEEAQEEGQWP